MTIRSRDAIDASVMNNCIDATSHPTEMSMDVASELSSLHQSKGDASARKRSRLRRFLMGVIGIGSLGLLLTSSTGCTTTSGVCRAMGDHHLIDDFMVGHRNRVMAEKAWHCQKHRFCNMKHSREFKQGFIDGFNGVAEGGDGCNPSVAPKQFWGWRYQSVQGQSAVSAWFEGYPMGVAAAESAGIGEWGNIQTVGGLGPNPQTGMPSAVPPINPFYQGSSSDSIEPYPAYESQPTPSTPTEADSDDDEEMEDSEEDSDDDIDLDSDSDEFDFGTDEDDDSVFNGSPIFKDQAALPSDAGRYESVGDARGADEAMPELTTESISVSSPQSDSALQIHSATSESFEDSLDNLFAEEGSAPEARVAEMDPANASMESDSLSISDQGDVDALPFSFE